MKKLLGICLTLQSLCILAEGNNCHPLFPALAANVADSCFTIGSLMTMAHFLKSPKSPRTAFLASILTGGTLTTASMLLAYNHTREHNTSNLKRMATALQKNQRDAIETKVIMSSYAACLSLPFSAATSCLIAKQGGTPLYKTAMRVMPKGAILGFIVPYALSSILFGSEDLLRLYYRR